MNALALVANASRAGPDARGARAAARSALPDREDALAAARDIHETYMRCGFGAGMAKFIALVSHQGEFPDDCAQRRRRTRRCSGCRRRTTAHAPIR